MVFNHKENEKIHWKNIEERTRADGGTESDRLTRSEIKDSLSFAIENTGHEVDEIGMKANVHGLELGEYYIAFM
ncbi:MAG: hypothetical protein GEU26_19560, partial [Nitrososphaeraceae archaeon]|nr:hypothetical protein [Nitrososphaeraceae archaeon]